MANDTRPWRARLADVDEMVRDLSRQTDPQQLVKAYRDRLRVLRPVDHRIGLSRRGLAAGQYRITRSDRRPDDFNPWDQADELPILAGGLLGDLLYRDEPTLLEDFHPDADDPALYELAGMRSLFAMPLYDGGHAVNMVVALQREPQGFDADQLPELLWMANLFGRATAGLVLAEERRQAFEELDRELRKVADMQRALLPAALPEIPGLELAAHYQPARRAGGDYYDFFPLPDGQWGLFMADISGHGTPAAVLMAVTHALAHTHPGPAAPPGKLLEYLNRQLCRRYTDDGAFATAFYGIYDPRSRSLQYARAGHNPPRLRRCFEASVMPLEAAGGLPLGVDAGTTYRDQAVRLVPGDQLVMYTDGLTEAAAPDGELFGEARLDGCLAACGQPAQGLLDATLAAVAEHRGGRPADDDVTIVVARAC